MTSIDEQETIISWMRDDSVVGIYTSNTVELARLRKLASPDSNKSFVKEVAGGEGWADFEVPIENFKLYSALRNKREMSDEQRAAAAERLANARSAR